MVSVVSCQLLFSVHHYQADQNCLPQLNQPPTQVSTLTTSASAEERLSENSESFNIETFSTSIIINNCFSLWCYFIYSTTIPIATQTMTEKIQSIIVEVFIFDLFAITFDIVIVIEAMIIDLSFLLLFHTIGSHGHLPPIVTLLTLIAFIPLGFDTTLIDSAQISNFKSDPGISLLPSHTTESLIALTQPLSHAIEPNIIGTILISMLAIVVRIAMIAVSKVIMPLKRMLRCFITSTRYFGQIIAWSALSIATNATPMYSLILLTFSNAFPRAAQRQNRDKPKFKGEYLLCSFVKLLSIPMETHNARQFLIFCGSDQNFFFFF